MITREWINAWRSHYMATDEDIAPFEGATGLTLDDLRVIVEWKQQSVGPRRIQAVRNLERNSPTFAADVARRALATDDELAALTLLCLLRGIGPATASAVLTALRPSRYTVADANAWVSLVEHGYFSPDDHRPWHECWVEYLNICRSISEEHGVSLRDLDRALWAADGATGLPG